MMVVLKEALKNTGIRKDTLFRMIDFQYFDLERQSDIRNIEDLEVYAENTRSLLIYLNLNLLNINDRQAYIAASHIGRGVGIVDVLKKLPSTLRMNINMIPSDIIDKTGCSVYDLWDRHGTIKEEFYDCILEMAAYAKKHIEIGRTYNGKLPKNSHAALLIAVESYEWLLELEKLNFNIFDSSLQKMNPREITNKILECGKTNTF